MDAMDDDKLPLEGIKILDLSRLIPGAFCTALLSDAGAEVIKVEEIHVGDYERQIKPFVGSIASRFLILNRNKKSVALNLKTEEGRKIFLRMVNSADILIEGFRPGAMGKLGLDYDSLREKNSRLIYCSISSFGQDGPYRDIVAHDINILGMSGFFDITGVKAGPPIIPGVQIADTVAGMNAAVGILLALIGRQKTNKGRFLDISMFDGIISWIFDAARYIFSGERAPRRGEGRLWGSFPNYNIYETLDGKYITVGALESKFKKELLRSLGREDLIQKVGGTTSTELTRDDRELFEFFKKAFLTKTRDEWINELEKRNICMGPVNTLEEALGHPQTVFRKMVVELYHPSAGRYKQIGSALKSSIKTTEIDRLPAPRLGEHTREIMASIGYDDKQIDALAEAEVVAVQEATQS